jgi:predicted PurR-regulated permease PerM
MTGPSGTRVLELAAAVALIAVGLPLWKPLLLGAVLAGALSQFHERLAAAIRGRRSVSAALVTVGVVVLLLVPVCIVAAVAVKEALGAIAFVSRPMEQQHLPELLGRLPAWLARWVSEALARGARTQRDLATELATWPRLREALGTAAGVVGSASHVVLMAVLMLVALFFLLRDGPTLVGWAEQTPTMPPGRVRQLLLELRGVAKSVLGAQLGSGLAQSVVATIGYALAGVPDALGFGVVSLAASFLPIGGVSLVGVPLAALLWLTGHPGWAIFLAIWTIVLTGLIDNLLRPLLVRGATNLNGGLVFFALLGGLLSLGPIGIVAGPLSLALFLSISTIARREHGRVGTEPGS